MSDRLGKFILWILWRPREFWYRFSKARVEVAKIFAARHNEMVKIEIGGGETPRMKDYNFKNMDVRNTESVDIVGKAWELSENFGINNIGYIYTRHVLEHLAEYELEKTFIDWKKVTQSGCVIEIIVPNISFHITQMLFLSEKSLAYSHCIAGFNGWQRCEGQNYWDVHKNIFTEKRLLSLLQKHFSFSQINFDRSMRKNVHFFGVLA
ncbi:hypothetical protein N9501_08260 [Amylibacter sp.]|nr:hypothetical protein [Amylibacter sp.]